MTNRVATRLMSAKRDDNNVTLELSTVTLAKDGEIYPLVVSSQRIKGSPMPFDAYFPIHQMERAVRHHLELVSDWTHAPIYTRKNAFELFNFIDTDDDAVQKHLTFVGMYNDEPDVWITKVAKHFDTLFPNSNNSIADLLTHTDKTHQYREVWKAAGIPFNVGVLLYLLTFTYPFTLEVRATANGFVEPAQWVIDLYENDMRVKQFLAEQERGSRMVVVYWLTGTHSKWESHLGETQAQLFNRMGYGGGAINSVDFIDDRITNYADPLTHVWVPAVKLADKIVKKADWVPKKPVFQN